MLSMLYVSGLRPKEIVSLDVDDYDPVEGFITVRTMRTARRGKRVPDGLPKEAPERGPHKLTNKGERSRYMTAVQCELIEEWLCLRGFVPGPLFCPIAKDGAMHIRRLSRSALLDIMRRRAQVAGVDACSPFDLLRTMIRDLLDAGADISTVQRIAGHANLQTTVRYDHRGDEVRWRAANLLRIPYTLRSRATKGT